MDKEADRKLKKTEKERLTPNDDTHEVNTRCGIVNRDLLPIKMFYFFACAGFGVILPLIPIFMRQLKLSPFETGLISGIMPFVGFLIQPLIGLLVDRFHCQRPATIIFCIAIAVSFLLMLLVPPKYAEFKMNKMLPTGDLLCLRYDNLEQNQQLVDNINNNNNNNSCMLQNTEPIYEMINENMTCLFLHETYIECGNAEEETVSNKVLCPQNLDPDMCMHVTVTLKSGRIYIQPHRYTTSSNRMITPSITSRESHEESCKSFYMVRNISFLNGTFTSIECIDDSGLCDMTTWLEGYDKLSQNRTSSRCFKITSLPGLTFGLIFVLYYVGVKCNNAIMTFADASTYSILGENRRAYGRQRFFGSLGMALFCLPVTFWIDIASPSDDTINFAGAFYVFAVNMFITAIISWFVKQPDHMTKNKRKEVLKMLIKTILDLKVILFIVLIVAGGSTLGLVEVFRFWFLRDLGSSPIVFGVCLLISTLSDMTLLQLSPVILRRLSEFTCLLLVIGVDIVRVLAYSFVTSPWYALPIELLHGFTFSLFWVSASSYATTIAPPGMMVSLQSLACGMTFGLGRGLGALLTGIVYNKYGYVWTFRAYSASIAAVLIIVIILNWAYDKRLFSHAMNCLKIEDKDVLEDSEKFKDRMIDETSSIEGYKTFGDDIQDKKSKFEGY